MDQTQIVRVVRKFFKTNGGATLMLPDGWFGRPFDNHHELWTVGGTGPSCGSCWIAASRSRR